VETSYPLVEVSPVEVSAEGISEVIISGLSEEGEKNQDILVMKNGDRISGIISQMEIQTNYGLIEVAAAGIELVSFSVEPPLILGWKFPTGASISSSAIVGKDKLYVGSWDHFLYALSGLHGEVVWKYEAEDRIYSAPTLNGDLVYIATGDGYLCALDAESGQLKWRYSTGISVYSSPVV
ncbi:unnamed protein product, partial [marine sediment metagenome]